MLSSPLRTRVQISERLTDLSDNTIQRMAEIVANYFPDQALMEETVRKHLVYADTIRLAICEDCVTGFSIASKLNMLTPFYPLPVNIIFQRMLYLDPNVLFRGLGIKLLSVTVQDLFGRLWPMKRLVAICRTQNPTVARIMNMYNVAYPQYNQSLPSDIRTFCESLLPMLGAESLDEKCRLIGTLSSFKGRDYTDLWNRYLQHKHDQYESLMLSSAFSQQDGRVYNSGAFVLMIAYAKPLHFIRYIGH